MRYLILILALIWFNTLNAQWNWPVQVNAFTTGPYYNYLSYYGDQNDHLQVLVTLTDQNASSVPARLHLRIEGPGWWVETNPTKNFDPIFLEPFVPNVISGVLIEQYLRESNLILSDPNLDLNNLPEGYTEVCVEVIGIGGTFTISGNQCAPFWLQRFQPPQAFNPVCGAQLDTNSMFHNFQWTHPIGFTPTMGTDIQYTFSLYEWVDQNNYTIFDTGEGLVYQTVVTNQEQLVLNDFEVQLQNGMEYVWRVEAQLFDNGNPIEMIENNGLSEICTFTYGEAQTLEETLAQDLVLTLEVDDVTQYKGSVSWDDSNPNQNGLQSFPEYLLEYRLKPDSAHPNPTWHYDTLVANSKEIYQLSPATTYEVRVSGIAGNYISTPTPIEEMTTDPENNYACGDEQIPFRPGQFTPNENVQVGDQVQIGQFLMTITEAIPQYEPGRYGGQGWIPVEFLGGARANVEFENVLIDNEYVVRDGRVDVTTDGVDAWLEEQLKDFVDPIYVNGTVDSAWVDTTTNTAWVVVDGQSIPFTFDPPDYPIVIHDDSGMSWTIWPNGTITVEGYLDPSNDYLDVSADSVALFTQNDNEAFGFDGKEHMAWHENYEIIQLPDSTYYFVANKSIGKDLSDVVNVTIPYSGTPVFKLDDQNTLNFSPFTPTGSATSGGQNGTTYSVTIPPISSQGRREIYVYNAQNQRLGKLNIHVYKKKERELVIVPIANTAVDETQLKAKLDATLKEANLDVSVTVAPQWNDATFTSSKQIALPQNLTVMTDYSQDMRDLRDAYFNDTSNQKNSNAYYLFVIPEFDDANADGYMVKGKALGFVKGNDYQVYAHELAHGMGGLGHSWKFGGPEQGTTDNLMDYAPNGENVNLTKAQWKELRDFDLAPSMWDDVEDGSSVTIGIAQIPESFKNSDGTYSFFAASGEVISLPVNTANVTFSTSDPLRITETAYFSGEGVPIGTVSSFAIDDGNEIIEFAISLENGLSRYVNKTTLNSGEVIVTATGLPSTSNSSAELWESPLRYWQIYFDTITKTHTDSKPILGFPYYEFGEIKFQIYSFLVANHGETNVRTSWGLNSNVFFAADYIREDVAPPVAAYWLEAGDFYGNFFQSIQGSGVKISSGLSTSMFSPEAQQYLERFEQYAGPDYITAPFIIALAQWVTEFDALADFSSCILDNTSNADPFYTWNPYENIQEQIDPYGPHGAGHISSENDPSMAPIVNSEEQALLFEELWSYYDQFKNGLEQAANGFNVETEINQQLENAQTKSQIEYTLDSYYSPNLCNYWLISGENRIHAIEILSGSTPTENQLKRIVDLTSTSEENGQALQLYNTFFENNGEIFWKVTDAFTDGINYPGYNDFVHVMLNLAQLTNPFNEYQDSIGVTPYSINVNGNVLVSSDEVITQLDHTEYPSSNTMHFFCRTKYTNTTGPAEYFISDFNCSPDAMIRVRLMDFSYTGNDNFYRGNKLLERDIIMPAFYLSYLEYNREFANSMVAVNGIVDVIAIITALPTAGTSTTAAVTVSLATTNIVVTANQSSIQNTSWGNQFMSAWEVVQMIDLGNGIFQIAKGVTKKVIGGLTYFFLNSDEIITAFKSDISTVKADGLASYQMIRNALKKLANNADTEAAKLYQYIVQELDAEYILNFKNTFLGQGYGMKFFNNRNLAVVKNGNSSGVLTLEKNSNGPFLKGNIVDDILPNAELCSSLDDVRFRKNSSTNVEEGDLDVYKKADGSYQVVKADIIATGQFSKSTIQSLDGFSDNISSLASNQGLSISDFKLLQQKRYDIMTPLEQAKIDAIRNYVPMPDGNTILQKVIPKSDIPKYLDGTYNQVGGFVTTAKDAKHLVSFDDIYKGMRLDYTVNGVQPFNLSDGSCGVIRYKTTSPNAQIPRIESSKDKFPFTGNGFTSGNYGRLGVPEWKTPYNTPLNGAELWEVAADGSETLIAVFNQNQFIAIP